MEIFVTAFVTFGYKWLQNAKLLYSISVTDRYNLKNSLFNPLFHKGYRATEQKQPTRNEH